MWLDPQDLSLEKNLLHLVYIHPGGVRTGISLFYFDKVSFMKHSNVQCFWRVNMRDSDEKLTSVQKKGIAVSCTSFLYLIMSLSTFDGGETSIKVISGNFPS